MDTVMHPRERELRGFGWRVVGTARNYNGFPSREAALANAEKMCALIGFAPATTTGPRQNSTEERERGRPTTPPPPQ
jgi:hypothetical protein